MPPKIGEIGIIHMDKAEFIKKDRETAEKLNISHKTVSLIRMFYYAEELTDIQKMIAKIEQRLNKSKKTSTKPKAHWQESYDFLKNRSKEDFEFLIRRYS